MNTVQIHKVLTKHVKYFQGFYPINLLTSTLIKQSIIIINLDKLHALFALGSCLFFRIWVRRIFWFVWATAIQIRNHSIPTAPLNFLDIQRHQITRFNNECLWALVLSLRPPQIQAIINNAIREHVCNCPLHLQRYKGSADVPRSV